jgi:hypothetical protein
VKGRHIDAFQILDQFIDSLVPGIDVLPKGPLGRCFSSSGGRSVAFIGGRSDRRMAAIVSLGVFPVNGCRPVSIS